jgi:hypothetical protein
VNTFYVTAFNILLIIAVVEFVVVIILAATA